jgi:hypothetical protein
MTRVSDLIEAAERVCAEAEAHEEQWSAADYDLYGPLREALDAVHDGAEPDLEEANV